MPSDQTNKIIIYQDDDEVTRVSVRFAEEDLWLTQNQLAEIYCTTQENISMHVTNIYKDGELDQNRTNKKFLLVRQEGTRQVKRNIDHDTKSTFNYCGHFSLFFDCISVPIRLLLCCAIR